LSEGSNKMSPQRRARISLRCPPAERCKPRSSLIAWQHFVQSRSVFPDSGKRFTNGEHIVIRSRSDEPLTGKPIADRLVVAADSNRLQFPGNRSRIKPARPQGLPPK